VSTERSERRSYRAAQQFRRGVTALELEAEGISASREQLQLFAQRQRRDLEAANRALARLRAKLGAEAVARAVLRDRHLPEGRFALEPLERLAAPRPAQGERVLVRRLLDGAPAPGGLTRALFRGPFVLSGGWWRGDEVHREYHYARTGREDLLWVYREAGRWILQGRVE
jgi:protein ImuB